MNSYFPSSENDAIRAMRQELAQWSVRPRIQHADLAGRYVAALEGVVNTIAGEAQVVASTRLGRPGDAEIVAWRIDGDILDGEFDFATRASMTASFANERASAKDCLTPNALTPRIIAPALRKELGAKGLYVAGVEYKKVPLKKVDGPLITINRQYAKIARMSGDRRVQQAYAADHKQTGEVAEFPRFPAFETLESLGYAAFCLSKVHRASLTGEITDALGHAASQDKSAPYKPDNLSAYNEITQGMPRSVEDKIRLLGEALYNQRPGEELSAHLIATMLDPDVTVIAELAQLNKSKYVQRIQGSRNFTPALNNQLAVVAAYAPRFQTRLYPLMLADKEGYDEVMGDELQKAKIVVRQAEAFHTHLSAPETIPLDPKHWEVRGTL